MNKLLISTLAIVALTGSSLVAETLVFKYQNNLSGKEAKMSERQKIARGQEINIKNVRITDTKVIVPRGLLDSEYFYQRSTTNKSGNKVDIYKAKQPMMSLFYMKYLIVIFSNHSDKRQINFSGPLYKKDGLSNISFEVIK